MIELLFLTIALAFIFDFINGFHDAANSIATIVSTRVLTPFQAVIWAAFFNVLAFWIGSYLGISLGVANTVKSIVQEDQITLLVISAGLIAAIFWNLLTWWFGIPSSSSHTLIGGFAGAAIAHAGFDVVNQEKIQTTIMFIFLAPFIGMLLSYIFSIILLWICRKGNPRTLDGWFKKLQLVSSALFSIGHGGNDAQKVMGIIAAALLCYAKVHAGETLPEWMLITKDAKGSITHIPFWAVAGCYGAIGIGTMSGGWKIVKTMGSKITKVTPFEGVVAETAGALTLFMTQYFKIPVSTTHTITGSIIGVGLTKRVSAVRWGVTINLLWAWILTIPVSAIVGGVVYKLASLYFGHA
jgi:inorganic phosphate transporter, PiT family